ncbi:protein fem-1 homolog C [Pieris napi]|uniref:protein fem-1 homolog C n=1 Tax=Pieris napi TaxID=78633 RepID=UPI001FBBD108|nr:protein fem-1 homolog C [Pieris napi]XP_047526140.1 protein fem-1 homolog C [Pieris napi]
MSREGEVEGAEKALLENIANELMQECRHSAPGARLTARVRTALERLSPVQRREVVSPTRDGCAPLFVACRRGNAELAEYLVHVCDAPLEQRGVYEVPDDRSAHSVTPLWCAAVAGRLAALTVLADAGADLDAASDSGSTPVRSACFMTHLDVVEFLVQRGADVNRPNHHGGTCLINSVQSARLCAYLLQHGARVDACDTQNKTALHYAIQEHRVETARLLLRHGASPHLTSRAGDDALRTACLKGASQIVALLLASVPYGSERCADAHELLGATQLDEFNDVAAALASWRRATEIRYEVDGYIEKRPWQPQEPDGEALRAVAGDALEGAHEWRTLEELEELATDADLLRTQALLVASRTLGPSHKDCMFRLMYRGAAYADAGRYQRCVDLWTWALHVRIVRDTLLHADACHTASALTRLLLDAQAGRLERAVGMPRHEDVARVFELVAGHLPECRRYLNARPMHKKQAETFDRALRCVTHLLHLLLVTARDDRQRESTAAATRRLVEADVRSAHTGDTLLHLVVSRLNVVRSTYFTEEAGVASVFPSAEVAKLLLACGANPRVRNEARSTALHVAAIPYNQSMQVVETLLAGGAHLDQPNKFGDSAGELLDLSGGAQIRPLVHMTLACFAARALLEAAPPPPHLPAAQTFYAQLLPRTLLEFLDLHRPLLPP